MGKAAPAGEPAGAFSQSGRTRRHAYRQGIGPELVEHPVSGAGVLGAGERCGLALSENLGRYVGKDFAALPEMLRNNLARYDITARDWDLIRQIELERARGYKYLTADGADRLPDEAVRAWLGGDVTPAMIAKAREDITSKLGTYFTDQVAEAVNQPGAYERFATTLGRPAGTIDGAAIRAFMQFKTFGVSVARRHFGRELFRQPSIDKLGLAYLILGTTAMGYASMEAKRLITGRNPHDPQDNYDVASLISQAFLYGGSAGIYGDLLLADYDQFGRGVPEILGGPTIGSVSDVARLYSSLTSKETAEAVEETGELPNSVEMAALRLVRRHTPFQNLIWTKTAVDYLIFYQMQEAINPGYIGRMQRRAEKQGTTYWLPPSEFVQ